MDWQRPSLPQNSVFLFHLADTQPLNFSSIFKKADAETKNKLDSVSMVRSDFLAALKSGDPEAGITTTEIYLPHLFGLIDEAKALPDDAPIPRLKISWTSSLGSKYSKKYFTSDHWHFEAVNAILQYGLLYREKAHYKVKSLDSVEKIKTEAAPIAKILCFAAGIFDYIRDVELARWTHKPMEQLPEKYTEYYTILSALSIAEAQQLAINKGYYSGMSYTALAKLCLDVQGKFKYVSELLESPGFCDTFLMPQISSYCRFNDHLYENFAFTLLGIHASEKGEYGKALGYLSIAVQRGSAFDLIPKDKTADASRIRQQYNAQLQETKFIYERFYKENSTIYYEPVPTIAQLEIPSPQHILEPRPWSPPTSIPIKIHLQETSMCNVM